MSKNIFTSNFEELPGYIQLFAIGFIIFCIAMFLPFIYSRVAPEPELIIYSETSFKGDAYRLEGEVKTACDSCRKVLYVNNRKNELTNNSFSYEYKTEAKYSDNVNLKLIVYGGVFGGKEFTVEKLITIEREAIPVTVEVPESSASNIVPVTLQSSRPITLTITGHEYEEVIEVADSSITVEVPMNTSNIREFTTIEVQGAIDGYAPVEQELQIKNENYDVVAAAKNRRQNAKKRIQADMSFHDVLKDISIAINPSIRKTNSLGYQRVDDPSFASFVQLYVEVLNNTFSSHHVNATNFTVENEHGYTYKLSNATYNLRDNMTALNIQSGAKTSGSLAFVLPDHLHEFTLVYDSFDGVVRKKFYVE